MDLLRSISLLVRHIPVVRNPNSLSDDGCQNIEYQHRRQDQEEKLYFRRAQYTFFFDSCT